MLTSEKDLQPKSFANIRDHNERGLMEETQLFLAECGWTHEREDFFSAIARFLAAKLGMDFVCIDVLTGDKLSAQTLSIYFDGNFEDNITYELKDTPCADVVKNNVCCFVKNVRHFFPNDSILQEMKAESYAGTILRDSSGNPIGLIAVIGRKPLSNVHLVQSVIELVGIRAGAELERKKAEDELRQSEEIARRKAEELKKLMDMVPAAILIAEDSQCRSIIGNRTAARMLETDPDRNFSTGTTAGEVLGTGQRWIRGDRELRPSELPLQLSALTGKDVLNIEIDALLPSGRKTTILGNASPLFDDQGQVRGALGAYMDITDRKHIEEKLRESESKYRRIVQTAAEAIAITDAEARITFVNDRWSQLLGYSQEEAQNMSLFEQFFPEDVPLIKDRWESQKSGQHERYEFRLRHKEGRPVWSMMGVTPRIGPKGEFMGILSMTTDISELKQVEALLRGLNLNLESKVAERTAELQNQAHQLKELALLLTETENRERKRLADILHDDLQQNLAAAISHLGFVSSRWKHDAFSQEMTAQISRLLKEAIGISRNLSHELNPPGLAYSNLQETFDWLAGQMQLKHGITVHVDILDEIVVQSEALKTFLFKAAQEMLFNAIKHAKVQECRIKLRRRGENISLLVSDRGCGFTIKEARKQGGSGLLRLRERANLLGGSMRIHSRAGKGSTVRIVVPDKP